jgi:hypothetical protein
MKFFHQLPTMGEVLNLNHDIKITILVYFV